MWRCLRSEPLPKGEPPSLQTRFEVGQTRAQSVLLTRRFLFSQIRGVAGESSGKDGTDAFAGQSTLRG